MRLSLTTKREHIRHCILQKKKKKHILHKTFQEMRTYILMAEASGYTNEQEITKINNDLNWIKNEVMNTLTDNIPYIENCMMTTYVRNGKLFVEIIDGRTVDIMRREDERNKENKEQNGMAKLYAIMNG